MACNAMVRTKRQQQDRDETIAELDQDVAAGKVKLKRSGTGTVAIENWATLSAAARGKWCEGCAITFLGQHGSWLTKNVLAQFGVKAGQQFTTAGHGHPHQVPK